MVLFRCSLIPAVIHGVVLKVFAGNFTVFVCRKTLPKIIITSALMIDSLINVSTKHTEIFPLK